MLASKLLAKWLERNELRKNDWKFLLEARRDPAIPREEFLRNLGRVYSQFAAAPHDGESRDYKAGVRRDRNWPGILYIVPKKSGYTLNERLFIRASSKQPFISRIVEDFLGPPDCPTPPKAA